MPGIVGIIRKEIIGNEEEKLKIMIESMLHESFYTHGTYSSPENGFYIGYCAFKDSFADCMPIFNETKDTVMFITGECYMDSSIMDDLRSRGHQFNPDNASYLVHLYEEKGEGFFSFLNGWYNGIVLDLKTGTARLFTDRCGMRHIYVNETDTAFVFASEVKAILKAFPELKKIDNNSIGDFLTYDCVLDNRTYFSDISLIPAASEWSLNKKWDIEKRKYPDYDFLENQPALETKQFLEELGEIFLRILPKYFMGGPIGMSISGGLDTRSMLACVNFPYGKLPCYTFSGTYRDIWDVRIAPKVARIIGQPHKMLVLDEKTFLKDYPALVERCMYLSDGLEGVTKADILVFNNMAREIAPVRMTGKYGSQVVKDIVGFQERIPNKNLIDNDFRKYIYQAREKGSSIKSENQLTFLFESVIPLWWNVFAIEASQVDVRSPFLDNELIDMMYRAPVNLDPNFGYSFELGLIRRMKPELLNIITTGTYGGKYPWPIPSVIKNWIKFTYKLDKVHMREEIPFGMTHVVGKIDSLLSPLHLDKLVMGLADFRRYRVWFRDQLSGYVREMLLDNKTLDRPYWNKKYLKKFVEDHINGRGTYLREIRKTLHVELIHRILMESL